jgi:hypothetical protein
MVTEQFGTFVTDVKLVPYIRPQNIKIVVRGLKANTIFYPFFDGEKMSEYCSPGVIPSDWDGTFNTSFVYGTEGGTLRSNAYGELVFNLRLPTEDKRFRVGTREIKVTDSPTNSIDATSYAENYFVGHGLIQQKQNTILSTKQAVVKTETVTETKRVQQKVEIIGPSCMAYSFLVNAPEDEDGVFLTSVDVWIQSIDTTNELGVWFEIREMDNSGGITRTQVPYSEVWMRHNDPRIKTSEDASVATNVNFENPVFLQNNTEYAFIIHTEGLNPNTYFFISRLGETDIASGKQVTARQLTGNVYTTNNNLNWDMVPDIDLKIRFNRASFSTNSGTAMFGNSNKDFLTIQDRSQTFVNYGEEIRGSEQLILTNITGTDSIEVGDFIVGDTSGVSGEVIAIDGSIYYTNEYDFETSETFTVTSTSSPVGTKDVVGTISSIMYGSATLEHFNRRNNVMTLKNSNGYFFNDCSIKGILSSTTATVQSVNNKPFSVIHFNPNYLIFKNTNILFSTKTVLSSTGTLATVYKDIIPKTNVFFNEQRELFSYSNEIANLNGSSSSQLRSIMSTTSEWVSPVIDINRTNSVYVYNILNDDVTGETEKYGGNLKNKYISSIITLAEGQDAEDLLVYTTAYVPPGITTEFPIKIWAKILNNEDGENINQKSWIELEKDGEDVYSSLKNKFDYKDFKFSFPSSMVDTTSEINPGVFYESNGNTYTGFKQFAIKVGLLGNENDTAIFPKVTDIRVIALQL